jgi:hypothetical protein
MRAAVRAVDRAHWFLVPGILVGAAALRFVALDNPSYDPHSTRQYRSAIIARAKYYAVQPPRDDARVAAAARAVEEKGALEVPLTETLAAAGYAVAGRETPAVPRLLCSLLWLAGGFFVYSLARRLVGREAALVALAYQVLSAYSVIIGRSFQPEALLVASMAGALLFVLRHHQSLAARDVWLAAAATALSIVAKPVSAFFLLPAFLGLGWLRLGARRLLFDRATWLFLAIAGVPLAFYAASTLMGGALREQASMSLEPSLPATLRFWRNWAEMLGKTHGLAVTLLALLGAAVAPRGAARVLLVALWLGYFAYGLVFAYHISTHPYYQAPFTIPVALSLASLAVALFRFVRFTAAKLALGVTLSLALAYQAGTAAVPQYAKRPQRPLADYRAIGEAVNHSPRVVYLSNDSWGSPLVYHGEIAGWPWLSERQTDARERHSEHKQDVRTLQRLIRNERAEYFVSTSVRELRSQRQLAQYLERKHRLVAEHKNYVIYELRSREKRAASPLTDGASRR